MFSIGPVAVGFAYSGPARRWATITKLTRNALIGVLAVGYAAYYARHRLDSDRAAGRGARLRELWDWFPKFVVGFIALILVASASIFSVEHVRSLKHAYNWLFLLALVGLGIQLCLAELRRASVGGCWSCSSPSV